MRTYCLDAELFEGAEGEERLAEIHNCRADLQTAGEDFYQSSAGGDASSWLFCTCGRGLAEALTDRWGTATLLAGGLLCLYLVLLLCVLCVTCKGAAKAKKRKKENALEMQVLKQAEAEGGMGGGDNARWSRASA